MLEAHRVMVSTPMHPICHILAHRRLLEGCFRLARTSLAQIVCSAHYQELQQIGGASPMTMPLAPETGPAASLVSCANRLSSLESSVTISHFGRLRSDC